MSASDEELVQSLLGPLEQQTTKKPIELVFLGDIFELLRSTQWETLWTHHVAPWKSMSTDFLNFPPAANETAFHILKQTTSRYPEFSKRLKALTSNGKVRTHYVPGNHDFMVQLSADSRLEVADFLGLDDAYGDQKFLTHYANAAAEVYAVHGNSADPLNWHDGPSGRWAFGDAIVLRLVNFFVTEASRNAGLMKPVGGTPITRAFQDLENVQPSEDLALYFRFILERQLTNKKQRQEVLTLWRKAVDDVLALEDFTDERQYGDRTHRFVREALALSKNLGLTELLVSLRARYKQLFAGEDIYLSKAQEFFSSLEHKYRYIVFGHTHEPLITPLVSPISRPAYYVNTGCWRRIVMRRPDLTDFRAMHVRSYFVIEDDSRPPLHRLVREVDTE